jgi:hypothetical protein
VAVSLGELGSPSLQSRPFWHACKGVRRGGYRLTRFVVGETLILSTRMPMTLRHGTCDREVEMTPPTQTAAATAEVDVRASA